MDPCLSVQEKRSCEVGDGNWRWHKEEEKKKLFPDLEVLCKTEHVLGYAKRHGKSYGGW